MAKLFTVCHNHKMAHTYYAQHKVFHSIQGSQIQGARPTFKIGVRTMYKGIAPAKAYFVVRGFLAEQASSIWICFRNEFQQEHLVGFLWYRRASLKIRITNLPTLVFTETPSEGSRTPSRHERRSRTLYQQRALLEPRAFGPRWWFHVFIMAVGHLLLRQRGPAVSNHQRGKLVEIGEVHSIPG